MVNLVDWSSSYRFFTISFAKVMVPSTGLQHQINGFKLDWSELTNQKSRLQNRVVKIRDCQS